MQVPGHPADEQQRLAELHSLNILDTPAEERFDRITRIAKALFQVPIAQVSLVDSQRQWFKSCTGLPVTETSREVSYCGHAILYDDVAGRKGTGQQPSLSMAMCVDLHGSERL